jgi:hypothetical protein
LGKHGSIEGLGIFRLNQECFVGSLPYDVDDFFQIPIITKCDVPTRTGEYKLHISGIWQTLAKTLRMRMWHKVIATGAVFLRPPFELSLERTLAIGAIVSAPGKRTPLADRKLIHIGFTFHLIDSPSTTTLQEIPVTFSCVFEFYAYRM